MSEASSSATSETTSSTAKMMGGGIVVLYCASARWPWAWCDRIAAVACAAGPLDDPRGARPGAGKAGDGRRVRGGG